ncbi:MAG TPA: hypothetical protein ACFYD3_10175 [Candidatus Hypogeohydataceae bacterium YC41]
MPDTFDPSYSWLKTWKENPTPPILFYGTSSNHIRKIGEKGLAPGMEGEDNLMSTVHHVLSSARKLGDQKIVEQAELILLEHGERLSTSDGLKLTFNYHQALYLARKKTRRLEALQWLCETFRKRVGMCEDSDLAELTINRVSYSCNGICDLHLSSRGVVVYVRTDLSKFQNLPPLLKDKKGLKKALKGKQPQAGADRNQWPKSSWWKKLSKSEVERRLEKSIRGDENHPGLGEEVFTFQYIPPPDIIRIELASEASAD